MALYPEVASAWSERERPTTHTVDVHELRRDYSVLPANDSENTDYLQWLNGFKQPLQRELRSTYQHASGLVEQRGLNITDLLSTAAQLIGTDPYPRQRVVLAQDMRGRPGYEAAAREGFFKRAMVYADGDPAYGQFEYMMHFIRLRAQYVKRAPRVDVADTLANLGSRATLARQLYVHIGREEGDSTYHWYGYAWRARDRYWGDLLDEASAAKVAAETRQEMGIVTPGKTSANPVAEKYRDSKGYFYGSLGAMALDLVSQKLRSRDPLSIYRPLWRFMLEGQASEARAELDRRIKRASGGNLTVHDFEAVRSARATGLVLALLRKVEEGLEIDASKRPSKVVKEKDLYAAKV